LQVKETLMKRSFEDVFATYRTEVIVLKEVYLNLNCD
jgi:hypothetical protein